MNALPVPEPFTDAVIDIRRWGYRDVDDLIELVADPEISKWTGIPSPYTKKDAKTFLKATARAEAMGMGTDLCIQSADTADVLGGVGLKLHLLNHTAEVGYWIAKHARRRGVAVRAVRLMARWSFEELGVERMELLTHVGNSASEAVAERCGFSREGVLRSYREIKGRRVDLIMFSLLPGELPEEAL